MSNTRYSLAIISIGTPIAVPIDDIDPAAAHNICIRAAGETRSVIALYDVFGSGVAIDVSHYGNFVFMHNRYLNGLFQSVAYYAVPTREMGNFRIVD